MRQSRWWVENYGSINGDKDETKELEENKMKSDQLNLTVDQEDGEEQDDDGR